MSVVGQPLPERVAPVDRPHGGAAAALLGLGTLALLGAAAQLCSAPAGPVPWLVAVLLAMTGVLLAVRRTGDRGRRTARVLAVSALSLAGLAIIGNRSGAGVLIAAGPLTPGLLAQAALLYLLAGVRRPRGLSLR